MQKLIITGFFDRDNCGDEAFKDSWNIILQNTGWTWTFVNIDLLVEANFQDVKILLCGGGDILNKYFLNKVECIRKKYPAIIVYAVSVGGLPENWSQDQTVDIFDRACFRSETIFREVSERINPKYLAWLPDMNAILPPLYSNEKSPSKRIGIYITRPMCDNPSGYTAVVKKMAEFITEELRLDPTLAIHLIPFNTDSTHQFEDDQITNKEIYDLVPDKTRVVLHKRLTVAQTLQLMSTMHLGICFRFHSHLFHIMLGIPFISLCHTRKVKLLMSENGLSEYQYSLPKASGTDSIADADLSQFRELYQKVSQEQYEVMKSKLEEIKLNFGDLAEQYRDLLKDWIKEDCYPFTSELYRHRIEAPVWVTPEPSLNRLTNYVTLVICYYCNIPKDGPIWKCFNQLLTEGKYSTRDLLSICKSLSKDRQPLDEELIQKVTKALTMAISFAVTNQFANAYCYGIIQALSQDGWDIKEAYKWLVNDWANNYKDHKKRIIDGRASYRQNIGMELSPKLSVDLVSIEQVDYSNIHRAGWGFVYKHLFALNNPNAPIMVDCYADKTFGWCLEQNVAMGLLPYTKPWIGIFHHTNAKSYSKNNIVDNISTKEFEDSLVNCRGLITLSQHLKEQIEALMAEKNMKCPPITVLYHPSEETEILFDWDKFVENKNKKIIQIGSWYRNSYAIYRLPLEKEYRNPLGFAKAAIKGRMMENYFRPKVINLQMTRDENGKKTVMVPCTCNCKCDMTKKSIHCNCNSESFENKYAHGLLKTIEEMDASVEIIEHLPDEKYDLLMSENVVFLNLIDASACNTVIECIFRNTPLLVNRNPAVEEYIGTDYPLFYDNLLEAVDKLSDFDLIKDAHEYLAKMDKSKLSIQRFISDFVAVIEAAQ